MASVDVIAKMPKVELHVHLDGAMRPSTLWDLAKKRGIKVDFPDEAAFRKACICREGATLPEFLEKFAIMVPIVSGSLEGIERVAYEFVEDKASEGVVYAEARYAPQLLVDLPNKVTAADVVEAVNRGLARGNRDFGIEVRSILCCMRHMGQDSALVADLCVKYKGQGVVGIDLAGDESRTDADHPDEPRQVAAFQRAFDAGVHRTVHAAESGPAWNAWEAVEILHAERIGHCYHCLDDGDIYAMIQNKKIHIEICPISSLQTGAVHLDDAAGWRSHPLVIFAHDGAHFSINTDDPTVCGVDLVHEYRCVADKMGLGMKALVASVRNAADAAFLENAEKQKLKEKIEAKLKELGLA